MNNIEKSSSDLGQNVILNFGPQHPAAHGVLRLILELDGEVKYKLLNYYYWKYFYYLWNNVTELKKFK